MSTKTASQILNRVYTVAQCADAADARIAMEMLITNLGNETMSDFPAVLRRYLGLKKVVIKFEGEAKSDALVATMPTPREAIAKEREAAEYVTFNAPVDSEHAQFNGQRTKVLSSYSQGVRVGMTEYGEDYVALLSHSEYVDRSTDPEQNMSTLHDVAYTDEAKAQDGDIVRGPKVIFAISGRSWNPAILPGTLGAWLSASEMIAFRNHYNLKSCANEYLSRITVSEFEIGASGPEDSMKGWVNFWNQHVLKVEKEPCTPEALAALVEAEGTLINDSGIEDESGLWKYEIETKGKRSENVTGFITVDSIEQGKKHVDEISAQSAIRCGEKLTGRAWLLRLEGVELAFPVSTVVKRVTAVSPRQFKAFSDLVVGKGGNGDRSRIDIDAKKYATLLKWALAANLASVNNRDFAFKVFSTACPDRYVFFNQSYILGKRIEIEEDGSKKVWSESVIKCLQLIETSNK